VLKTCGKGGERVLDVDQIQSLIAASAESGADPSAVPFDDELPGGGQFYDPICDKHFISADALAKHKKTRVYKRQVKAVKEEPYDPDFAAGKSKERLPPAHGKK
jgi:bud site selection protein 20